MCRWCDTQEEVSTYRVGSFFSSSNAPLKSWLVSLCKKCKQKLLRDIKVICGLEDLSSLPLSLIDAPSLCPICHTHKHDSTIGIEMWNDDFGQPVFGTGFRCCESCAHGLRVEIAELFKRKEELNGDENYRGL